MCIRRAFSQAVVMTVNRNIAARYQWRESKHTNSAMPSGSSAVQKRVRYLPEHADSQTTDGGAGGPGAAPAFCNALMSRRPTEQQPF